MASQKMGLHVSDRCRSSVPGGKGWFEFREFATTYWYLLADYKLLVTESTAAILDEVAAGLKRSLGIEPQWDFDVSRERRSLINKLVGTCKEDVERVLFFLDPHKLEEELESLFILREAIAEHGQKLNINRGVRLWAEKTRRVRWGLENRPVIGGDDAIVFVGQNLEIDRFALAHLEKVLLFPRLILTARARNAIKEFLSAADAAVDISNTAYDKIQDITSSLVEDYFSSGEPERDGKLAHVIACPGRNREQVWQKGMEDLISACADPRMRVNLMLNKETAEEWIRQPLEYHNGSPLLQ